MTVRVESPNGRPLTADAMDVAAIVAALQALEAHAEPPVAEPAVSKWRRAARNFGEGAA